MKPPRGQGGPSARLHGAADLERELIEVHLPRRRLDAAFAGQPPQGPVGADVVEAVIVHADVREVRRHPAEGARPSQLEERAIAGRIKLQERRAVDEAFASIRSTRARCIVPSTVKTGAPLDDPRAIERQDLRGRQFEHPVDCRKQIAGRARAVAANHERHILPIGAACRWDALPDGAALLDGTATLDGMALLHGIAAGRYRTFARGS